MISWGDSQNATFVGQQFIVGNAEALLLEGDFYVRVAWQFTGENLACSEREPRHQREPYTRRDTPIGCCNATCDIALWGKNLTGDAYLVRGAATNIATSIATASTEGSYLCITNTPAIQDWRRAGLPCQLQCYMLRPQLTFLLECKQ